MSNKKRKQHYVWEHYLTAWSTRGQVWCQRGESRFCATTDKVGQRRDFYRLKEMSVRDLELVQQLVLTKMDPELRELARGWIPHFTTVFHLQKLSRETGGQNAKLEKELDIEINNLEEEIHASVENAAVPILASLRQGDASILDDPERYVDFA